MSKQRFALGDLVTYRDNPYIVVSVDDPDYLIQHEHIEIRRIWTSWTELSSRKKANKYGAVKVQSEDGTFDSQAEYARWLELKLLQEAGEISNLKRQVSYNLIRPIEGDDKRIKPVNYRVDFVYREGIYEVANEVKGHWSAEARIKAYLFMVKYPHIKYVVTGTQL